MAKCWKPPIRFWIAVMIFFTTFTNYMLRVNMPVSVLEMVDTKAKNFTPTCLRDQPVIKKNVTKDSHAHKYSKFDWAEWQVGIVKGCYFWGYMASVLLGGIFSGWFGPWNVIFYSSIAGGVLTALSPLSTMLDFPGIVIMRILTGVAGGVAYPAVNFLIGKWAPPKEKGKFLAAMQGNTIGSVVGSNLVAVTSSAFGWPWGFYSLAILMAVYCAAFAIVVSDTPEKHRWISEEEKNFILEAQAGTVSKGKKFPPLLKMLKSSAMWCCVIAQFGNLWSLNIVVTELPDFMKNTMGFELKRSALVASLPYIARMLLSMVFAFVGDWTISSGKMSLNTTHFIPAALLMSMSAVGCNKGLAVALMVLQQGINGACVVSSLVNPQDLSPNFSGTVYGIMNFIGMTTGQFVPSISAAVNAAYNRSLTAVVVNFCLGGAVLAFCGIIFILFGTSQIQPWNEITESKEDKPTSAEPAK